MLRAPESVATQTTGSRLGNALTALQLQIHDDLRVQNPDWVQPNGDCPTCDFYEARLAELLEGYQLTGSDESVAAVHRIIEEAASMHQLPAA